MIIIIGCSSFTKYFKSIENIAKQKENNKTKLELHLKENENILASADNLNMTHELTKNKHENIIDSLEKRNTELNKGRLCNSLRRVYDYDNKECTNKYITSIDSTTQNEINDCYNKNNESQIRSYVKIGLNIFMFFIYLMVIVYFAIIRK